MQVRGYIETVYLKKYTYVHSGVANLLKSLETELKCNVIYLTTRPIEHQKESKQFLEGLEQDGCTLPKGQYSANRLDETTTAKK